MDIVVYLVIIALLVNDYRKLRGADKRSLDYQEKIERLAAHSTLVPSKKVHIQVLFFTATVVALLLLHSLIVLAHSAK
jgi:hypothetical protein